MPSSHLHSCTHRLYIFTSTNIILKSSNLHVFYLSLSLSLSPTSSHTHSQSPSLLWWKSYIYTCRCAPLRSRATRPLEPLRTENQNVRFDFVHSFLSRKVVNPNNDGLDPHDRQNQGRLRIALAQFASHSAGGHASKKSGKKTMRWRV